MRLVSAAGLALVLALGQAACAVDDDLEGSSTLDEAALEPVGQDALLDETATPSAWMSAPTTMCSLTQLGMAGLHMTEHHPGATMTSCNYNPSTGYIVYGYSCDAVPAYAYANCLFGL